MAAKTDQIQMKLDPQQGRTIRDAADRLIERRQEGSRASVYREWLLAAARREMASGPGTGADDSGNPYELAAGE